MTEMSPAVTFTNLDTSHTGGSCGQLLPNTQMKVIRMMIVMMMMMIMMMMIMMFRCWIWPPEM